MVNPRPYCTVSVKLIGCVVPPPEAITATVYVSGVVPGLPPPELPQPASPAIAAKVIAAKAARHRRLRPGKPMKKTNAIADAAAAAIMPGRPGGKFHGVGCRADFAVVEIFNVAAPVSVPGAVRLIVALAPDELNEQVGISTSAGLVPETTQVRATAPVKFAPVTVTVELAIPPTAVACCVGFAEAVNDSIATVSGAESLAPKVELPAKCALKL